MIILGINAYHGDASACLLVDGALVAAAEEERFRRIKHWAGFPAEAVRYCLAEGGLRLAEVDHVAVNSDPRAQLLRKMRYALDLEGFRFLHLLSPCPTGWKSEPAEGIALLRLAVRSGLYPVFEVIDGQLVINQEPDMCDEALERYFAAQGRFASVDLEQIRAAINAHWRFLQGK